jgi:hypothetical protein
VVEHPCLIGVRDERESSRGHVRMVARRTDTSRRVVPFENRGG